MVYLNKGLWAVGIPLVLSSLAVIHHSAILLIAFILAHFLVLKVIPLFKNRESIWMFIIVAFSTIPINAYLLKLLNDIGLIFGSFFFLGIMKCVLYYMILFSIEEIIMGVITRLIWTCQYKNVF